MSERAFAGWVAEIAETLVEDRRALIAFAREAPPEFWELPSAVDRWTNHDVLAHVSGGNDQLAVGGAEPRVRLRLLGDHERHRGAHPAQALDPGPVLERQHGERLRQRRRNVRNRDFLGVPDRIRDRSAQAR